MRRLSTVCLGSIQPAARARMGVVNVSSPLSPDPRTGERVSNASTDSKFAAQEDWFYAFFSRRKGHG